jgi:hypothetical protein
MVTIETGGTVDVGGTTNAGWLFAFCDNQYPAIGSGCALIYALGMLIVLWRPIQAGMHSSD